MAQVSEVDELLFSAGTATGLNAKCGRAGISNAASTSKCHQDFAYVTQTTGM